MSLRLPEPLARYFETERSRDVAAQTQCFTEDAIVTDEGQTYRGASAISAWKEEAQRKFNYECEPLSAHQAGNVVTVKVRISGNFDGSPVELDHAFTLAGDKISSLAID